MAGSGEPKEVLARGLAKAALHLANQGNKSAISLVQEAIEAQYDLWTVVAQCRVALSLYDVGLLKHALADADRFTEADARLQSLAATIRVGPLRAVELAERLYRPSPRAFKPVDGRILYVLHKSLPHENDGYATRSHELARALLAMGNDLICVTRPGFPHDLKPKGKGVKKVPPIESDDGVAYHRLPLPMRSDFPPAPQEYMAHASIEYLQRAADTLTEVMRHHRPACVIAASNSTTGIPACLAARRLGLPFVYEVRGFWELSQASKASSYLLTTTGRQERFLEVELTKSADAVITLTSAMRDELSNRGVDPARIALAPNACDPAKFSPAARSKILAQKLGLSANTIVIGYIGSFNDYEGLDCLTKACARLRRKGLDCRLLLVGTEPPSAKGDTPLTHKILKIVEQSGCDDWLIMPGRVPHGEVPDWYSLVDIAPFPRRSLPVTELVSPMKPIEAMAMGKAVVVSSVGGLRETVNHDETGLVFPKEDFAALEEALLRLSKDRALRQRLGESAREWVTKNRSWSHTANAILTALAPLSLPH